MKSSKATILLVEDDVNLGYIIKDYLEMQGYTVDLQKDGDSGLHSFQEQYPNIDLCILDIMMPLKDGYSLAEDIKKIDSNIPVIFLSAKNMKEDRIRGLKIGADDYITKPFSSEELSLRIEAILRRYRTLETEKKRLFKIGKYTFDYSEQILVFEDKKQNLTKREAEVLQLLCANQNRLVRRETALENIWGENDYFKGRSMDVYITKLRKYLKNDASIAIQNIHGTGFKLEIKDNQKMDYAD